MRKFAMSKRSDRSLIVGAPAKVVRSLDNAAAERLHMSADHYAENAARFARSLSPAPLGRD